MAFVIGAAIGAHFGFEANGISGAIGAGMMGGVVGAVAVALGFGGLLNASMTEDGDQDGPMDHHDLPGRHD